MIYLLIPLIWLALLALLVAVCTSASRSDAEPVEVIGAERALPSGLLAWEDPSVALHASRAISASRDGGRLHSRRVAHSVR